MRKIFLFIFSLVLSLVLIAGCSRLKETRTEPNNESISTTVNGQDLRKIAYSQLTSEDKERIKGTWKKSKLYKRTLDERMGNIIDKSYIGKEVYVIDFPTKGISKPNNMIVYLSIDNNKLLGYGYVD